MPPFNRFPILRLPLLPFELITKSVTPLDIFSLAVTSYKAREHLRKLALKLEYLHLNKQFGESFCVKLAFQEQSDVYQLSLDTISSLGWQLLTRNRNNIWRRNGKQYVISRDRNHKILQIKERTDDFSVSKEILIWISELLSEIFTFQKVEIDFFHVPKEVVLPVVTTNFRNIYKLSLHHLSDLTSEELSSLLEECSVEQFRLSWNVKEGVKYRNSLRYPTMTLWKAHWLTIDCLLDMECVSLTASNVLLTIEDVKKFVTKWSEGGFEKLKEVRLYHEIEEMSWESVLDDFEKKPLEQEDFDKINLLGWDSEHGWEIERSDGKRAAVIAKNNPFNFIIL